MSLGSLRFATYRNDILELIQQIKRPKWYHFNFKEIKLRSRGKIVDVPLTMREMCKEKINEIPPVETEQPFNT